MKKFESKEIVEPNETFNGSSLGFEPNETFNEVSLGFEPSPCSDNNEFWRLAFALDFNVECSPTDGTECVFDPMIDVSRFFGGLGVGDTDILDIGAESDIAVWIGFPCLDIV